MIKSEDFFIEENKVIDIPDTEYQSLETCIEMLDAFARTTYASIYVIDYFKRNFLYVSDNPLFLSGYTADQVKEMGYEFYIRHVIEEDLELLLKINKAGFDFTESISPAEDRLNYSLTYDFHIKQKDGKPMLINHKITPFRLAEDGRIWLALCTVSLSSNDKAGNMIVFCKDSNERLTYNFKSGKWKKQDTIQLKEMERNMLRLSAQGYTVNEIAERLCKSIDTVKLYRKQIFEKLDVENITEAISYVTNHKLI